MRRHHTTTINSAFVKVRRAKLGITMHVAAKRAGISTKHWSNVENGRARPSIDVVVRMAEALRCRADELLTDTAEMSINYLEKRIQETIQMHESAGKLEKVEPLEVKEMLVIMRMLGYFDVIGKRQAGYDADSNQSADELILTQYRRLYANALNNADVDRTFLEFVFENRNVLHHLLSSAERDAFQTYIDDRGMNALPEPTEESQ